MKPADKPHRGNLTTHSKFGGVISSDHCMKNQITNILNSSTSQARCDAI